MGNEKSRFLKRDDGTVYDSVTSVTWIANDSRLDLDKEVSGHYEYCHDLSLVKSVTNWTPEYSLEEGLKKTYETMKRWNDE